MAAMALGMAQRGVRGRIPDAKSRKQFGTAIFDYQAVQFMLADMSTDIAAARLLIHHGARLYDDGRSIAKEAAHPKLFTTDMAMKHITERAADPRWRRLLQEYRIERHLPRHQVPQTYEGTNQIQRLIIARQIDREMADGGRR